MCSARRDQVVNQIWQDFPTDWIRLVSLGRKNIWGINLAGVLVHEWLSKRGGSENVVVELARMYPDAPISALWDDAPDRFEVGRVRETWLAKTPLRHHKAAAVPFMPTTWRHLGYSDAEWILSSSHLFAHHARFSGPARHAKKFVYAHTPARYIWTPELDMRGDGAIARAASRPLQKLDRMRAQEIYSVAANSAFVGERVKRVWGRDATVIYPPVSVARFSADSSSSLTPAEERFLESLPEGFILGASRFVSYKRLDVAIEAGAAADLPVVIAGDGPDEERLRKIADEHPGRVTFVTQPSSALLNQLYRRALVFVFPPIEDFGIMPVEAMAAGTPVIANRVGGAAETVVDGVTGALLDSFDNASLRKAVETASSASAIDCVARAWEFDVTVFEQRISAWLAS